MKTSQTREGVGIDSSGDSLPAGRGRGAWLQLVGKQNLQDSFGRVNLGFCRQTFPPAHFSLGHDQNAGGRPNILSPDANRTWVSPRVSDQTTLVPCVHPNPLTFYRFGASSIACAKTLNVRGGVSGHHHRLQRGARPPQRVEGRSARGRPVGRARALLSKTNKSQAFE